VYKLGEVFEVKKEIPAKKRYTLRTTHDRILEQT
jgi:hypothetical protein